MKNSQALRTSNFIPVGARILPVWAVALVLGFAYFGECRASTGSSPWNDQPAWAVPSDSPPPRRAKSEARYRDRDVSPFTPGSNNLALDVGQVFLLGDLGNKYSDSIGAQLHYTYGVSDLFGFDVSGGYSSHSSGEFSMATLLAGLRTNLSWYDKVIPYFIVGMGFYKPSYQLQGPGVGGQPGPTATLSPVLFGMHVGPGVDLELTKQMFFGAALTFHDVFGGNQQDNTTGLTSNVGGTFASFLLHVGYTF